MSLVRPQFFVIDDMALPDGEETLAVCDDDFIEVFVSENEQPAVPAPAGGDGQLPPVPAIEPTAGSSDARAVPAAALAALSVEELRAMCAAASAAPPGHAATADEAGCGSVPAAPKGTFAGLSEAERAERLALAQAREGGAMLANMAAHFADRAEQQRDGHLVPPAPPTPGAPPAEVPAWMSADTAADCRDALDSVLRKYA
jgi:hypothetical protein